MQKIVTRVPFQLLVKLHPRELLDVHPQLPQHAHERIVINVDQLVEVSHPDPVAQAGAEEVREVDEDIGEGVRLEVENLQPVDPPLAVFAKHDVIRPEIVVDYRSPGLARHEVEGAASASFHCCLDESRVRAEPRMADYRLRAASVHRVHRAVVEARFQAIGLQEREVGREVHLGGDAQRVESGQGCEGLRRVVEVET